MFISCLFHMTYIQRRLELKPAENDCLLQRSPLVEDPASIVVSFALLRPAATPETARDVHLALRFGGLGLRATSRGPRPPCGLLGLLDGHLPPVIRRGAPSVTDRLLEFLQAPATGRMPSVLAAVQAAAFLWSQGTHVTMPGPTDLRSRGDGGRFCEGGSAPLPMYVMSVRSRRALLICPRLLARYCFHRQDRIPLVS